MADNYHVIKIVVESGAGDGANGGGVDKGINEATTNTQPTLNAKNLKLAAGGAMIAKRSFDFATSNIGTFTGNSRLQNQINNTMKLASHAAHIAISPITGIAALGLDITLSEISRNFEIKLREDNLEMQRFKLNYNSINRSRN